MATKNYKKKIAVVGYTGFIGSNLKRIYKSNFNFNSKKITKINKKLDLVLCAGTYSKRWIANKYPKKDLYNILKLTSFLKNIVTKRFVLISTIEVYGLKNNKNELDKITTKKNSSYGINRLFLEKFVKKNFINYLIIRLPIVYGKNFVKNVIYDLLNDNKINDLNANDKVQIYNIKNLKKDIDFCFKNNIKEYNIACEPISLDFIAKQIFKIKLLKRKNPRSMNMKSIYPKKKSRFYSYKKKFLIKELKKFVDEYQK